MAFNERMVDVWTDQPVRGYLGQYHLKLSKLHTYYMNDMILEDFLNTTQRCLLMCYVIVYFLSFGVRSTGVFCSMILLEWGNH